MGYVSTADQFGQFLAGCGTGCSCTGCGTRNQVGEWYVPEEDDEPPAAPSTAPPSAALSGYGRLGFYSQAPAPAGPGAAIAPTLPVPNVGPGLDPTNRLAGVHPELARRIRQTAQRLSILGVPVTITRTGGIRTFDEQAAIYAQGRTTPGRIVTHAAPGLSNHNYGLAVDLVPLVNGRPNWQVPLAVWLTMGAEGVNAGLNWGGNWTRFKDYPHFELPVGMSVQECLRIYNQGGLPAVWAEADRRLARR